MIEATIPKKNGSRRINLTLQSQTPVTGNSFKMQLME